MGDTKTQTQWKLKRLNWRLDETQKVISPACPKHALKAGNDESKKGIAHQDVRTIGQEELKSGWKSDYSTPDGSIELEFPMSIRGDAKPICDLKSEDGTEVSHVLVVEMIVAEEFCPTNKPNQITPTGAARVLRMHFNTTLTQRAGMGISWDEEQPPLYENVPASPPGYGGMVEELKSGWKSDYSTPDGSIELGLFLLFCLALHLGWNWEKQSPWRDWNGFGILDITTLSSCGGVSSMALHGYGVGTQHRRESTVPHA